MVTCADSSKQKKFRAKQLSLSYDCGERKHSAWKKWEEWCRNRSVCPFSADIQSVLEFLTVQFEEGRQYRSLNCYRSALSSAHLPAEGFPVRQHLLVCRLLKGIFNLHPPCPRYAVTWEVTHVLACVRSWGDNVKLDRRHVTRKLAVLLIGISVGS